MPRFENEGFDRNANNRNVDRTVPDDEDYYNYSNMNLNFNSQDRDDVVSDNQQRGVNPCNSNQNNTQDRFVSESIDDFERPQRNSSGRNSSKNKSRSSKSSNRRSSGGGSNNGSSKNRRRRKRRTKGQKVLAVILALVLFVTALAAPILFRINYDDKEDNEYVTESELESSAFVKNVLLIGVDARSEDDDETSRSDTMMLISLDLKHHCIKLVSFLRDTWVYIPSLGYEQRLNAACSSGGYQNVVDTIEYNFGIDIDSYVVADFDMFEILVDSLGGVEVDVTEAEANEVTNHPSRYGDVTLESGTQTLTGEQALAYCRIRKIDTDFSRTERQRTVMTAILNSAKSSNPFKLYKMAYNSAPYIETNMSKAGLIGFVFQALICVTGDIHQTSVPFDGTWSYATISGNSVISIDTQENKEQLIEYIYDLSSSDIEELEEE